jgi:hypothetical protein
MKNDQQVLGKRLRNLCVDAVSFDEFTRKMPGLIRKYPWVINQSGPTTGNRALHYAAERRDFFKVRLLLDHGANPLLKNDQGKTSFDLVPKDAPHAESLLELLKPSEGLLPIDRAYLHSATKSSTTPTKAAAKVGVFGSAGKKETKVPIPGWRPTKTIGRHK